MSAGTTCATRTSPSLDPGYADFHLPSQIDSQKVRRVGGAHVTFSPLLTLLMRFVAANLDTARYFADPYGQPPVSGDDPDLDAIYKRNIAAISAINRRRGVATIWVGQLLNRERLTGDGQYGWLPLVRDRDLWPMQQKLNEDPEADSGRAGRHVCRHRSFIVRRRRLRRPGTLLGTRGQALRRRSCAARAPALPLG